MLVSAASPSPYWFITRGTGAMALVLLTISVVLGIVNVRRDRFENVPRFVIDSLHRSSSLLAVAFLVIHILTSVLDGFAPITLLDAVVPFTSAYRPIWLGLGAISFDLIIAVTITSLLRQRVGYRTWRAIHWISYASWPIALVHTYGTGTDARQAWMLLLSGACGVAVVAAVVARVTRGWPERLPIRVTALAACLALAIGLIAWLPSGPLGPRWAERSGTPASVLAAARAQAGPARTAAATVTHAAAPPAARGPVRTSVTGTLSQSQLPGGGALVDIALTSGDAQLHALHIRIRGRAVDGGGVQMTGSRVSIGPMSNPDEYGGRITALSGTDLRASVSGPGGARLELTCRLRIPPGDGQVSGELTVVRR